MKTVYNPTDYDIYESIVNETQPFVLSRKEYEYREQKEKFLIKHGITKIKRRRKYFNVSDRFISTYFLTLEIRRFVRDKIKYLNNHKSKHEELLNNGKLENLLIGASRDQLEFKFSYDPSKKLLENSLTREQIARRVYCKR